MRHLTIAQLESGLAEVRRSPKGQGVLEMIVRRPQTGNRELLDEATLSLESGLVGDNWRARTAGPAPAHPDRQLAIMNARAAMLVANTKDRWQLAGDQLYIDLDLSPGHLPPGTRLSIGSAIVEVTGEPHLGCKKFIERFGKDAMRFVNSPVGKSLNLRGLFARVIEPGVVQLGSIVSRA